VNETAQKNKEKGVRRWWCDPAFVVGVALFLFGGPLNYFSSHPKILYLGAAGVSILAFYFTHLYVANQEHRLATEKVGSAAAPAQTPAFQRQLDPATDPPPNSNPKTDKHEPPISVNKLPVPLAAPKPDNNVSIGNNNQINNSAIVAGNNNQVIVNAQRSLSADQRQVIAKAMAPFAQDNYRDVVTCLHGDSESTGFAQDWVQALQEAGWKIPDNGYAQIVVTGRIPSMSVRVGSEERAQREPVVSLLKVFEALGLAPVVWIDTTFQAERFEISIGARPR